MGSTFNLVYIQDLYPARLQSKMVGDNDKTVVMGVLLSLWALTTAFQHQFAIIYNLIFQTYEQQHWPPRCTSVLSSLVRDIRNCRPCELLVDKC